MKNNKSEVSIFQIKFSEFENKFHQNILSKILT